MTAFPVCNPQSNIRRYAQSRLDDFVFAKRGIILGIVTIVLGFLMLAAGLVFFVFAGMIVVPSVHAFCFLSVFFWLCGVGATLIYYHKLVSTTKQIKVGKVLTDVESGIELLQARCFQLQESLISAIEREQLYNRKIGELFHQSLNVQSSSLKKLKTSMLNSVSGLRKPPRHETAEFFKEKALVIEKEVERISELLKLNLWVSDCENTISQMCRERGISKEDQSRIVKEFRDCKTQLVELSAIALDKRTQWTGREEVVYEESIIEWKDKLTSLMQNSSACLEKLNYFLNGGLTQLYQQSAALIGDLKVNSEKILHNLLIHSLEPLVFDQFDLDMRESFQEDLDAFEDLETVLKGRRPPPASFFEHVIFNPIVLDELYKEIFQWMEMSAQYEGLFIRYNIEKTKQTALHSIHHKLESWRRGSLGYSEQESKEWPTFREELQNLKEFYQNRVSNSQSRSKEHFFKWCYFLIQLLRLPNVNPENQEEVIKDLTSLGRFLKPRLVRNKNANLFRIASFSELVEGTRVLFSKEVHCQCKANSFLEIIEIIEPFEEMTHMSERKLYENCVRTVKRQWMNSIDAVKKLKAELEDIKSDFNLSKKKTRAFKKDLSGWMNMEYLLDQQHKLEKLEMESCQGSVELQTVEEAKIELDRSLNAETLTARDFNRFSFMSGQDWPSIKLWIEGTLELLESLTDLYDHVDLIGDVSTAIGCLKGLVEPWLEENEGRSDMVIPDSRSLKEEVNKMSATYIDAICNTQAAGFNDLSDALQVKMEALKSALAQLELYEKFLATESSRQ